MYQQSQGATNKAVLSLELSPSVNISIKPGIMGLIWPARHETDVSQQGHRIYIKRSDRELLNKTRMRVVIRPRLADYEILCGGRNSPAMWLVTMAFLLVDH